MKTPTVLLIMDGFGLGNHGPADAVWQAKTPVLDKLLMENPHTTLSASGLDVGLPEGQIGNSEVGHTNIGAGRVVFQDLPRISLDIKNGGFFKNPAYLGAMNAARESGGALHLLGLLSDGGVHSHMTHLYALLEMAKRSGLERVYIHAFLDGRDVGPSTGEEYVRECIAKCAELGVGKIATMQGRFFCMDRDRHWERLQKGYDVIVRGAGEPVSDPVAAVEASYGRGVTDEFMEPVICDSAGLIKSGDSVICFNFRPDRAREMTWALTGHLPEGSTLSTEPLRLHYVCTTQYDEDITELPVAYHAERLRGTAGEFLSSLGMTQLRIAETEKYAHVTFFFNGGEEHPYPGEDRVLIPSPREYATYDLVPEMSARKVTDTVVKRINSGGYDLVVLNFANCDMVGHTGVMDAAVRAVETVDECVGRVAACVARMGGLCLITADHGNADCMFEADGTPHTAHTTNPVPFIVVGADVRLRHGRLADIVPTMLELMGLEKPEEMTGESLIVK